VIAEQFFKGLGQTSGTMVIASVTIFVDRLELLSKGAPAFGADGPAARELLAQRGLTAEIVAEVQTCLDDLRTFQLPEDDGAGRERKTAQAAAQDAVWIWYREWSRILRHAITDRRWLRRLGLISRASRKDAVPELPESTEPADDIGEPDPVGAALSARGFGPTPLLGE
jgi:hypothetical protein